MTQKTATPETQNVNEIQRLEEAGRQAGRAHQIATSHKHAFRDLERRIAEQREGAIAAAKAADPADEYGRWLSDNYRLIRSTARETREFVRSVRQHAVVTEDGAEIPRSSAIARDYLRAAMGVFSEETLAAFLKGYQQAAVLDMGELWALKPALQLAILEGITTARPQSLPVLISSLRALSESEWRRVFETVSVVEQMLCSGDPVKAYGAMDAESRDMYRKVIAQLAQHSDAGEREIAETVIRLAAEASWLRARHVGYFLVDQGLEHLRAKIGFRAPLRTRIRDLVRRYPNGFYLIGIELATFVTAVALLSGLNEFSPIVAGFFLLLLPATQAAVDLMNNVVGFLIPPRPLPKLDFARTGIPDDCLTMVAVPTLLMNEAQVRELALDLEIRYLANRDRNLLFALLTDAPDADQPVDERDALVEVARSAIESLNVRYGTPHRTPFYLFHRHRRFNPSEGRWMGWERKRGKLLDLNQLLREAYDSFPVKVGDQSILPRVRYVITLDSDTQLPRDAAARLVGAMAHPLNRPVVDPVSKMVVAGYGILQPRIGISVQSAARSRLASIYSGQTGFDIYTRAVSDVYQDLFGEGIFTGKGIYDVDALRDAIEERFPENALLSHDLIEGAYARAGLVSDIELIDDYPTHFSAWSRRKHRWVRGDWQITRWLLPRVPDFHGNIIPNPIALISRWKILDNLRRSLLEPAILVLLLAGWFYLPGSPAYWTTASIIMLLIPAWSGLLFATLRAPLGRPGFFSWVKDVVGTFIRGHIYAALNLVFLLHQALLSIDAVGRTLLRLLFTRRKLLEWETAAEAEQAVRRKATVDIYFEWTPVVAAALGFAVWFFRPAALRVALPILIGWALSRAISAWLNRPPRPARKEISAAQRQLLLESAERICRFFEEWSSPQTNWLIPDNVREDGRTAMRLSPTNLGFLLNARIAALKLGHMKAADFVRATQRTLATVRTLPKYRGHLLNWYDIETLKPLAPQFVSTVDSGNLAACLWTLKQAARSLAGTLPEFEQDLHRIAAECDRLVAEMDFSFLYQPRKKVLSIGYDLDNSRLAPSTYDLLASESRIASFIAIAKGDIPQEAWFHLGRRHTVYGAERVLVSWTGTMFEYLMPSLWMRDYPNTIMHRTLEAVVRVQRSWARRRKVPWGVSESACKASVAGGDYEYAAFGLPEIAMKPKQPGSLVISPYSTFLALSVDANAAAANLKRMRHLEWFGKYGFYESVDYSDGPPEVIQCWMAHHQGMSLLAIANLLCDGVFREYFHSEPQVLATERLLHERVPSAVLAEAEETTTAAAAA